MKVGVIELMETGHIALAETICRIFCSDPGNRVILFTLEDHAENLRFLKDLYPHLSIVVKPSCQKEEHFLELVVKSDFDRIYVVTLNRHFRAFAAWKHERRLFLVIHNIDEWFEISPAGNLRKFAGSLKNKPGVNTLIYNLKLHFLYPRYKRAILENVKRTKGKLVVLSGSVYNQLARLKSGFAAEIIPFSVFDTPDLRFRTDNSQPLRICVPGILSQYRRDYTGLLDLMENSLGKYKSEFILDILGGVQHDNPLNETGMLISRINELKAKGFPIIIRDVKFISPKVFDRELSESDIILGNMNVVLNRYSEYGRTKETGLPFAMIKAAKPGILPENYPVPDEISSSVLKYKSYADLERILARLIKNPDEVFELQKKAAENSKYFTPGIIYSKLADEQA